MLDRAVRAGRVARRAGRAASGFTPCRSSRPDCRSLTSKRSRSRSTLRGAIAAEPIETTILATPGQIELHLTMRSADLAAATSTLEDARTKLVEALGVPVFSPPMDGCCRKWSAQMLQARGLTLAAAESCTGGLLLTRMTEVAGSSAYVRGGVVAYSNELKIELLGVDPAVLDTHGAVSEATAAAMADGVHARTAGGCVCRDHRHRRPVWRDRDQACWHGRHRRAGGRAATVGADPSLSRRRVTSSGSRRRRPPSMACAGSCSDPWRRVPEPCDSSLPRIHRKR